MTPTTTLVSGNHAITLALSTFLRQRFKGRICGMPLQIEALSLKDDLCLDSLDIAEMIIYLEDRFQIHFNGEEMPPIETVQDVAEYVWELVERKKQ